GRTTALGRSTPGETDQIMDFVTKEVFPQGLSVGVARGTYTDAEGNIVPRIPFLMRALAQNRDVRILSSIPLWAQNNTEASLSVVENIPILRSTIEGGSGTARDVIQNIDRMDVGIKLKLTPHVNPQREVLMQLNPSIEAIIDEGPADKFAPTIAKREVSTTVTVPDKCTVIISGLIREDVIKVVSKVPILGDIPFLGWLFRSHSSRKQRTNLLIFVTPHIVTDIREAADLKQTLEDQAQLSGVRTNLDARPVRRK
ncbi:MAG: type II and III secretion system protein, partial [Verrucomicrobia bacterium]|nr:type II and III secretion system protein [Verrucomicrobiota bacterium]